MKRLSYPQSVGVAVVGAICIGSTAYAAYWFASLLVKDAGWLGRSGDLLLYLFYAGLAVLCRGSLGRLYYEEAS